jgi:hypothetical protein
MIDAKVLARSFSYNGFSGMMSNARSVRDGFGTLAVVCETLAAASRLIDLMPGNEEGVIAREG